MPTTSVITSHDRPLMDKFHGGSLTGTPSRRR